MKISKLALSGLFLFTPLAQAADPAPAAAPAAAPVATAPTEKKYTGEEAKLQTFMSEVFEASRKVNTEGADKTASREKIQKAMDWERVAKDCLGTSAWNKASAANRKSYKDLLEDVIIRTAYTRVDTFMTGATYEFKEIQVKGKDAHVQAVFKQGVDDFTLDYYLGKKGAGWQVYDIAFEDIRYSENIREQIKAFLSEKGFPSLLAKLKERRDKLVEDAKTPAAAPAKKAS
ncbi:ABC transporter substrate-binding protein [bacterium]|nr:ABC transporter substrate-binding protein [bacterium]